MLDARPLGLDGVMEFCPPKFGDSRGFFSETFRRDWLHNAGLERDFVQDNHSFSATRGTLRGLHYQLPPKAQDKLVRVVHGAIFDVAVDIRRGSATFGRWVGLTVSAQKWNQILVPAGYAHGFVTLEPDTEVIYKVTETYSSVHDRSIRFDDPAIGILWPIHTVEVVLSEKDRKAPLLRDAEIFESNS
ncbi:dTDP-4-dehydrorhamnose 3,5-epimerase [Neoaquamicrobium sediminum]|uniref:dTDP-4-dehydrorhamnose 3,5-epimerase n=1 Tax=Neoaquamicrobium sediminum TaxID=1849104 RepID=UPI001563B1A0|nr:dTDP-4-dehydrorhamnose 3,5-epimerase [Mesorhizobium sediminum]NRC56701.1 dTDP-4-dehydrorhamnose 3,5-epimerase [Mesorhizobium sediminum]